MPVVFADRSPDKVELERFRLILSTYQDGSGMYMAKQRKWMIENGASSLPGWRDFERTVAFSFAGKALESKHVFDVLLPLPDKPGVFIGISCKMRNLLKTVKTTGRVTIELSNASKGFWKNIEMKTGLNQKTFSQDPAAVGKALISTVENWHTSVNTQNPHMGTIEIDKSIFLNLQYDEPSGDYQLFQFPLALPVPDNLTWAVKGERLIGQDNKGIILEWYGSSGGQLKYYPFADTATWTSPKFRLESLPENLEDAITNKAASYFPELWASLKQTEPNRDVQARAEGEAKTSVQGTLDLGTQDENSTLPGDQTLPIT